MVLPVGFKTDAEGHYILKDPSARKDYTINWAEWLIGVDIITAVLWTIEPGLVVHNQGNTTTATFIDVSGGEAGRAYVCTARITTVNGLIEEQSFRVVIRDN